MKLQGESGQAVFGRAKYELDLIAFENRFEQFLADYKDHWKDAQEPGARLIAELETVANRCPEDFTWSTQNGFCKMCGNHPVEVSIKERRVWISCSGCASLVADSMM